MLRHLINKMFKLYDQLKFLFLFVLISIFFPQKPLTGVKDWKLLIGHTVISWLNTSFWPKTKSAAPEPKGVKTGNLFLTEKLRRRWKISKHTLLQYPHHRILFSDVMFRDHLSFGNVPHHFLCCSRGAHSKVERSLERWSVCVHEENVENFETLTSCGRSSGWWRSCCCVGSGGQGPRRAAQCWRPKRMKRRRRRPQRWRRRAPLLHQAAPPQAADPWPVEWAQFSASVLRRSQAQLVWGQRSRARWVRAALRHSDSFTSSHKFRVRAAHTGSAASAQLLLTAGSSRAHNTGNSSMWGGRRWRRRIGGVFSLNWLPFLPSFLLLTLPARGSRSPHALSPHSTQSAANPGSLNLWQKAVRKELLFSCSCRSSWSSRSSLLTCCFFSFFFCLCSESLLLRSRCPLYFYVSSEALPLFFPMSHPPSSVPALIGWEWEVSSQPPAGASGTVQLLKKEEEMN